jgi:hypothetical protein
MKKSCKIGTLGVHVAAQNVDICDHCFVVTAVIVVLVIINRVIVS